MTSSGRPAGKPRGFYTLKDPWTKDTFKGYLEGAWFKIYWPLIKIVLLSIDFLLLLLMTGSFVVSAVGCIVTLLFYQDILTLFFPNTIKVGAMDH
mmetsp:Transcript_12966/g.20085  ORF Transcript_12966/g.20085 Transcript_12966/m.20085 type:complete len:95 (-) Transcript_12966:1442-1726(-)